MTYTEITDTFGVDDTFIHAQYGIPLRTLRSWRLGERQAPKYVMDLLLIAITQAFNDN